MKYLIASDIHGSAAWCKKVLTIAKNENVDKLLLVGDLLYHGPRNPCPEQYDTKAVYEMLNDHKDLLLCVRGNCEAEVDQMVLKFPVLADYAWLNLNGLNIFATHGHHFGEDNPPPLSSGDILLCGHTHVSCCHKHEGFTYLNPGSVSIPKENTPRGYMVLEDKTFTWKTLDGTPYMSENF